MFYLVRMQVSLPFGMPKETFEELKEREKNVAIALQKKRIWKHVWRVAGGYANVSIFDVKGPDHLHEVISVLPFFPFLSVEVTPLVGQPSSIRRDDNPSSE